MTKQQAMDRAGAAGTDPSTAATGLDDGQVSRSVILQAALRIIDRDGILALLGGQDGPVGNLRSFAFRERASTLSESRCAFSASCHAAKPRWPRLGPPSRAYRRASLSVTFQTSSSWIAEEIYQPSLTP